jgi:type IV pilus assembly protein PilY1
MFNRNMKQWSIVAGAALSVVLSAQQPAGAADLVLTNTPLFLSPTVAPLNNLVFGRDHKLYYEAYNDHSDLNGDGTLDVGYRGFELKSPAPPAGESPYKIDYFGYFDSFKCYTHDGTTKFTPVRVTATKMCGGAGEWSGDWLNYATTTRIDALRKVLYGGTRTTDTGAQTLLSRSHIPQDAHSWGKEYTSTAVDGYDIRSYTPYSQPTTGTRHLFANTTLMVDLTATANWTRPPLLRIALSQPYRIWNWVSVESPVAGKCANDGRCQTAGGGPADPDDAIGPGIQIASITDLPVVVEVCKNATLLEPNCRRYPSGNYKPIGLLQEYGENDSMFFSLLTGSYQKSKSGGMFRKGMGTVSDEINVTTDGTLTALNGIIRNMDRFKATGFGPYRENNDDSNWYLQPGRGAGTVYNIGNPGLVTTRPFNEGEFGGMWGNPIAEMMYEGLRFFAGKSGPTAAYNYTNTGSFDLGLGLSKVTTWTNPYAAGKPVCAKPFQTVMSDVNTSYDTDQIPGSTFASFTGDVAGFDAGAEAATIWGSEIGGSQRIFIGQSGSSYDGAPTPKTAGSFGTIRGLAPEEPTKEGGYYAASVAHFGIGHDINSASGQQNVQTFAVALASPLPRIDITVGSGKITLIPFAKSVGGAGINAARGEFQPTNQIVDFYVESLTPTSGTFQVNFEDVEAGNDHDMDAVVRYTYSVAGNVLTVAASSDYAAGGIIQHMGYVVSGSSNDGIYLVVRDKDTSVTQDISYFLDTPPGTNPDGCAVTLCARQVDGSALPLASVRTFSPGSVSSATLLKDPLWYAAKWGGFKDGNNNNIPDVASEWDTNVDGNPDNYFLVTNALTLSAQLRAAFEEIIRRTTSASSASVNSGSISSTTRVYQARFDTRDWTGQLLAFGVDGTTGAVNTSPLWDASTQLPAATTRNVITRNTVGTPVPFRWASLDATQRAALDPTTATQQVLVDYLRGDPTQEGTSTTYKFRVRPSKLGDIVSSSPLFVGAPRSRYSDALESAPYSAFVTAQRNREEMVYAGANDGMLHGFRARDGREVFAFIPTPVFSNLKELSKATYTHRYYVDGSANAGDVFIGGSWKTMLVGGLRQGGQGIYALDVTNPTTLGNAEAVPTSVSKWEFTDQNDVDLGFTYSQPAIVRLHNGKWAAVFGNGYNATAADGRASTSGNAVLFVVDISDGSVIKKFDTGFGITRDPTGTGRPNGLATPVMVDMDGDRVVDQAYVGDLYGNLWKIDLRAATSGGWDFAFRDASNRPEPLFKAVDTSGNAQPITVRPEVTRGPHGVGAMVVFGTGKYLEPSDKLTTPVLVQSFYGLIDNNTFTAADKLTRANLTTQTITGEVKFDPDGDGQGPKVRTTSTNAMTGRGWVLDLLSPVSGYQGEKQVTDPAVRGDRVIFTTLIPNTDPCGFGGTSWLMELDVLSGQRLRDAALDVDGDGDIDNDDLLNGEVPSGIQDDQILSRPEILMCLSGDCVDRKISSGSSGALFEKSESSDRSTRGRQSWRQIR